MTVLSAAPAADRGKTTIADRVVERIATRALAGMDGIGTATATANIEGNTATVRLRVSVRYPEPVSEVTGRARELVRERIGELTGLGVPRVDITVTALETANDTRRVR
ncbi:Asp23/Gls24 family envelope stress response protein [Sciscionella marina]|uniref:Asp23/Gls24 family envelope stress response protein n=1 Tax=Sciscionella marina TaxID=508770 RepID=UPI0003792C64|nr:Asp23/Gls24 family envelope stress response protein [Sciscionella marina]